ncbi:MAG TPA: aldehyde dehydrogenase family protein [Candidatus Limnocylindria bacterium]|nr:aldehyde dehydrogenase family protein [Candidatus Limnocylindria bacterium]
MADLVVVREPARPERIVGTFGLLDRAAVVARIAAAQEAGPGWAADAAVRATALHGWAEAIARRAPQLVGLLIREVGKPPRESRAEVGRAVAIVRYYAQAPFDPIGEIFPSAGRDVELRVHRRPLGVVAAICPWNFPVAIPAWKIAPALAYGNTVLFKPSSSALAIGHLLAEAAGEVLPPGVLELVPAAPDALDPILDDPRIAAVTFTGSVPVGSAIVSRVASRGAPVQAEMGGQNPSIVLDDADQLHAATTIAKAAMEFAGQKCTATRRVIVSSAIAPAFVPLLVDAVRAVRVGMPDDETADLGPLINEGARTMVEEAIADARSRGARLLSGGNRPDGEGWFIEPAILEVDDPSDRFTQEETFGPAVAVLVADSDEQALAAANSTRFGLAGSVFSTDIERARQLAERLDAGIQRVNAPTTGVEHYTPFGGDKASGYGPREQGRAAREFYTRTRTMLIHGRG